MKSAAAAAIFGASALWGLKAARKSGMFGAAVKGMIAVAVMNKARKSLVAQNGHAY